MAPSRDEHQREHYDRIIEVYEAHYDDALSRRYRTEFIYDPLFGDLDLNGWRVLEAMCGSGQATGYLLERGAQVVGLDIAPRAIARFRARWPGCEAVCASMLEPGLPAASFDAVMIGGGLHHVQPDASAAIRIVHRLLKAGGRFVFFEPHQGSVVDLARRVWYRNDPLFQANEEAIDLDRLRLTHAKEFVVEREVYVGGPAYIAVLNSMVLRVPPRLKALYAPVLFAVERVWRQILTRRTACFVLGRWQKIA